MSDAIAPAPEITPPAAPAPEVKPDPAPEKPVSEEISAGLKSMLKDRLKGKPTPKEEKKEAPPKEKTETPPKAEKEEPAPKPEPEPKPEKAKVKVTRKAPAPDLEAITTAATTAATKVALEAAAIKKPGQAPAPTLETEIETLPEEYREDVPVLRKMEAKWPEKYKGLTEKYVKASARIEAYRAQWEKDNPGSSFDPESHEHSAFIEANEVDWNDRDYGRALASIETESALEGERKKTNEKLEAVEGKLVEKELEPAIRARQTEIARELIAAVDKDFSVVIDEDGKINRKEVERLKEVDSFKLDTILAAASETARFLDAAERIFHPSGRFHYDDKNPAHVGVAKFLIAPEDAILSGGEETQVADDGRVFATRQEWATLKEGERRRRWRLEPADLVYLKQREQQDLAKKKVTEWDQRLEKMIAARGYTKGQAQPGAPGSNGKPREEKPAPAKPAAPSATDGVKVDTAGGGAQKPSPSFREALKARLRGQMVK
jgi:hypothetical protein